MAINLYLAAKHGKDGFFPTSLEDQALCHQWSFWGMTEVERVVADDPDRHVHDGA
jgi:glutathione S-transferase